MPDRDTPNGILVLNQPKRKIFAKKTYRHKRFTQD